MDTFYFTTEASFNFAEDKKEPGTFTGVAYSGAVLKRYRFWENFAIDLDKTKINKTKQIKILRDHNHGLIAGFGNIGLEDQKILVNGKLLKSSSHGQEIEEMAKEGLKWELSVGVFGGEVVKVENETVNGKLIKNGYALRGGEIREVSFVALGADDKTKSKVFNKEGENMPAMTQEEWIEFACSCGGDKTSSSKDLKKKFEDLQSENKSLKEKMKSLLEKLASQAKKDRKSKIEQSLKDKNATLSEDKIEKACESEEATETLLSLIEEIKFEKKEIKKEFTQKEVLSDGSGDEVSESDQADKLMKKAEALLSEGKASNLLEAIELAGGFQ